MDKLVFILSIMVVTLLILLLILIAMILKMSSSMTALKMNTTALDLHAINHGVPSLKPSSGTSSPHTKQALRSGYSVITDWSRGELIGRGGFGSVFLAIDRNSGALFATKQVPLLRNINGERTFKDKVDALRKEIKTLSQLSHVNIVQYLGTSKSSRNLYVHLEFVEGGSLAQLIHEFGALSLSLIQHYAQQILNGLQFLHEKGLVHRDIKPNNILVSKDGCCKLADFGCVKHLEELGERSSYIGTAIYMSPESHRQRDVCSKSDIWSFGCTIIECANGVGPVWVNFSRYKLFVYISGNKFDPQIPDSLGEEGIDFVRLCMMQKPENRADSATLLKHSFIVNKTRQSTIFRRVTSDSSLYGGLPNITRYVSDESGLSGDFENEKLDYNVVIDKIEDSKRAVSHVMNRRSSNALHKVYSKSVQLANGTNKQLSDDIHASFEQHPTQLNSIQDVQHAVKVRSQATKQKHLKWLVAEKSRTRAKSGGSVECISSQSIYIDHSSKQNTICITKGIAQSRENIQSIFQDMETKNIKSSSFNDCDFESI